MNVCLDKGLALQWSTEQDIDKLCSAMEPVYQPSGEHSDFVSFLIQVQYKRWAFGESSLMTPNDTVFVTDMNTDEEKIVAFTTLWKDTQLYKGITFSIGRVEFVGVVEEYRNRGLMKNIMVAVHEASDKRGDLMQTIVGIPYYYRQFDYEYALDIGMRSKTWLNSIPTLKEGEEEIVKLRAATPQDMETIASIDKYLVSMSCNYAPLRREYLDAQIRDSIGPETSQFKRRVVIFEHDGAPIGFSILHSYADPSGISVLCIGFQQGVNLPTMTDSILRGIVQYIRTVNGEDCYKKLQAILWHFSEWHPFFESLPSINRSYTSLPDEAYSTYVRIPNYANFVRHIVPVLDERLAGSSEWSLYSGTLCVNNYTKKHKGLEIQIKQGKVYSVQDWIPSQHQQPVSNMIRFPPLTFTNILLGNRSLSELERMYPDIMATHLTKQLVNVLFPKSLSINSNWV
jgi:hypothetical protein